MSLLRFGTNVWESIGKTLSETADWNEWKNKIRLGFTLDYVPIVENTAQEELRKMKNSTHSCSICQRENNRPPPDWEIEIQRQRQQALVISCCYAKADTSVRNSNTTDYAYRNALKNQFSPSFTNKRTRPFWIWISHQKLADHNEMSRDESKKHRLCF